MSALPRAAPVVSDRATPLELFFDLVYVFAFTQVTHLMADGGDVRSVLGGLAVLGVLWWSWASHAWLANQRAADRGVVRIGIVIAIAVVLILAIAIPEVYPNGEASRFGALLFATGFIVLSSTYTAVNLVAAGHDTALRRQVLCTMGATILPVSVALIGGALIGGEVQIALWLAAVVIEGATVYYTSRGGYWRLPSASHFAERLRLVVLLALGESIISIGLATSHSPLGPNVAIGSLCAVFVALGMWWVYFERVAVAAENNIEDLSGVRRAAIATVCTYLHFGIVSGILLASLGLGGIIEGIGSNHRATDFSILALGGGLLTFLSCTALYSISTRPRA